MGTYVYYFLTSLVKMNYFGDSNNKGQEIVLDESKLYICKLLYHFLLAVEENSHEIVEFNDKGPEYSGTLDSLYDGGDQVVNVIAAALNGVTSLFNNSCDVNTVKFHQDNKTIMIAKRNIRAGEEVSDFYGVHYFQSCKSERQEMLGFNCQCRPCRENWPLMKNLPKFSKSQLGHKSTWVKNREKLDAAVARMHVKEVHSLCKQLAGLNGVDAPHESFILAELYLHYSTVFLFGNKSLAFKIFSDDVVKNEVKSIEKSEVKSKSRKKK